jgi:hypothetical protein
LCIPNCSVNKAAIFSVNTVQLALAKARNKQTETWGDFACKICNLREQKFFPSHQQKYCNGKSPFPVAPHSSRIKARLPLGEKIPRIHGHDAGALSQGRKFLNQNEKSTSHPFKFEINLHGPRLRRSVSKKRLFTVKLSLFVDKEAESMFSRSFMVIGFGVRDALMD